MDRTIFSSFSGGAFLQKYGEEEGLKKYNNHFRNVKHSLGKIWIVNSENKTRQIEKEELEYYEQNNWKKGRKWKNK